MGNKRMHVLSTVRIDSDRFYERIDDKLTGQVRVVEQTKPSSATTTAVVETKPLRLSLSSTRRIEKDAGGYKHVPGSAGSAQYDTSQL